MLQERERELNLPNLFVRLNRLILTFLCGLNVSGLYFISTSAFVSFAVLVRLERYRNLLLMYAVVVPIGWMVRHFVVVMYDVQCVFETHIEPNLWCQAIGLIFSIDRCRPVIR